MSTAFPRSNVLVLGSNTIQSLLPSTLISQVEALLEGHRVEDAVQMADQQRKRLQGKMVVDDDEAEELRYVYQRIGFQCFTETLFDDAGRHLFDGDIDPRALMSYYPELCGTLFDDEDSADVFAGVAEHMPAEDSIDDIIAANLVMNYSPHLSPNTRSAPVTVELRNVLKFTATDMLKVLLRKWRTKRKLEDLGGLAHHKPVCEAVDTVLARLHCTSGETAELNAMIDEPNEIVLSEVEPVLIQARRFGAICRLYKRRGEDDQLLEAWSKLVTGEWTDKEVPDPLSSMFTLLTEKRDRALAQQWGVWLTKQDPERALKLLTSLGTSKRGSKPEDDQVLLRQIQEANPSAGTQFLEHLVLQKRSQDPSLHMELATLYVDQLTACLADDSTSKLWRAKAASYSSGRTDVPFLSYFASTTPDSDSKRVRLKTILFLQASMLYDPQIVRQRLQEYEKALSLELAIVNGKCGNDREALSILVHTLHDSTSAEVYCTLGGEVITEKTSQTLGERFSLQPWAALFVPVALPGKVKSGAPPLKRHKTVDEERKKELTKLLLEVYMSGGEAMAERTARLLSTQAMNLDVFDVLSIIPPEWPLRVLSSFLGRSFRRTLHAHHEAQLIKAISASQNLEVAERSWLILREQGAIVEEAIDDDGDGDEEGVEEKVVIDEKTLGLGLELDEKAGMTLGENEDGREVEGDGDGDGDGDGSGAKERNIAVSHLDREGVVGT